MNNDSFDYAGTAWEGKAVYPIVTSKSHPGGLRCEECKREILPGQPYQEAVEGMIGDRFFVTVDLCVYCGKGSE